MANISFRRSLFSSNPNKYISFLAGNAAYIPTAFDSIATATGTGSSGTITFSSIPSTYKHLQIRYCVKDTNTAGTTGRLDFNLNGSWIGISHWLTGNGSTVTASSYSGNPAIQYAIPYNTETNIMGVGIIDIHDYASTTKNKTIRMFSGVDYNNNFTGYCELSSALWTSTAAVSSLTFVTSIANFNTQTQFALYGIKG